MAKPQFFMCAGNVAGRLVNEQIQADTPEEAERRFKRNHGESPSSIAGPFFEAKPDLPVTNLMKAFSKLVERVNAFPENLRLGYEIVECNEDNGEYTDPSISFGETGIGVTLDEDNDGTIYFWAYREEIDYGVRYHSDGSGTPPSSDFHQIGETYDHPDKALIEAYKALIEREIDDFLNLEQEQNQPDF